MRWQTLEVSSLFSASLLCCTLSLSPQLRPHYLCPSTPMPSTACKNSMVMIPRGEWTPCYFFTALHHSGAAHHIKWPKVTSMHLSNLHQHQAITVPHFLLQNQLVLLGRTNGTCTVRGMYCLSYELVLMYRTIGWAVSYVIQKVLSSTRYVLVTLWISANRTIVSPELIRLMDSRSTCTRGNPASPINNHYLAAKE